MNDNKGIIEPPVQRDFSSSRFAQERPRKDIWEPCEADTGCSYRLPILIPIGDLIRYGLNPGAAIVQDLLEFFSPIYPPNKGFADPPYPKNLEPGTVVDRYGDDTGKYVSPPGTSPAARSLPPGLEKEPLRTYEVVKDVEVDAGKAAPWFKQPGGGEQYRFREPIRDLVNRGILRPLP